MDTSGFYKNENDSGYILHGPNFVLSGEYNLYRNLKDTYTYPVAGWYWFDSIQEAYAFWNIELTENNQYYPLISATPKDEGES